MNYFWKSSLDETVRSAGRYVRVERRRNHVTQWLSSYQDESPTSSNQGALDVPFQRWFKFKEAYSPKFVTDTLGSLPYDVERCLDPFGGSGTTALTCRMLGIKSVTTEVNPFLADLIRSKLASVDGVTFQNNVSEILDNFRVSKRDIERPPEFPKTMSEPGRNDRYIFSKEVFGTIRALVRRSETLPPDHARLLRVLLGSVLIENSNVRINGKGRRYRSNWKDRERSREDLVSDLREIVSIAVKDLTEFSNVPRGNHRVILGDARQALRRVQTADMAIFSPPYPNSFDYTDVYNIELWMLGYLSCAQQNQALRQSTLRSHVQTKWNYDNIGKANSQTLEKVVSRLNDAKEQLWDHNIPSMVQYYFDDLLSVFGHLRRILPIGHHAVIAIGDSQYAGILIDISKILPEVVHAVGFEVKSMGAIRSMRSSSQHGGHFDLSEHCIVFERIS